LKWHLFLCYTKKEVIYLSIFDINIIKNVIFYDSFSCGESTVFASISEYPQSIKFDIYAYEGSLITNPYQRSIAYIYTKISDNCVYIVDCFARVKKFGDGKKFFGNLFKYIININKAYPILKIYGFLSKFYLQDWEDLIKFYNSLNEYVSSNKNSPIRLTFKLRNFETSDLLMNKSKYQNQDIYFDIYITYL
jgi:hypothetical protein